MKKLLLLLCFGFSYLGYGQDFNRIKVSGKIIVESEDVSGITIFNATSNKGTITDEKGEFTLAVRQNDLIEVSALQFQNISFRVNEDIMKSRSMKIFLIDDINQLDTVVLLPNKLTGSLDEDMNKSAPFMPKMDALYFALGNIGEFEFEKDDKTEVRNIAVTEERTRLVNGLNVVNIVDQLLLPLFRSKNKTNPEESVNEVPIDSYKYYFSAQFLMDNFNIPENRVEDFIQYVQDEKFDYSLLQYGNEMRFLELLTQKSKSFLEQ
ncbi:carboxypeptidase-like regulatory domain-containing protein [Gaetbulibacter aestuarii]|uniref:Carboxypeptidase-like regulatory domain-containing protein n=1 Tax=Gaetbulibacter aestuarii TaxID=1502358 RepID=A0ABW7MY84_9FLAO